MGLVEIAALVGLVTAAGAIIRGIFTVFRTWEDRRLGKAMREKEVTDALAELRPNGGNSLVDRVKRNEGDLQDIKTTLKSIEKLLREK